MNNKILIKNKVNLNKNIFHSNKPINIEFNFNCINCSTENNITIIPFSTGAPFFNLYNKELLTPKEIIKLGIAKPSHKMYSYLGEYLVDNLPTIYLSHNCNTCSEKYLVVFGYGEANPNNWVCKISGIWNYDCEFEI